MLHYAKSIIGKVRVKMIMADVFSFKDLRQKAGYKIARLAREANVSPSSIYRIEGGERVTKELVQSVLLVINAKLHTNYTADDIKGLSLIGNEVADQEE